MHWSDQVGAAALGVRGHTIESYNDVYYPRKGGDRGNAPVYENSSGQLLFRDERNFPFVWVLSFSLAPDNLDDPATWCARLCVAFTPSTNCRWLMRTVHSHVRAALPPRMAPCRWARAPGPAEVSRPGSRLLPWRLQKRRKNTVRSPPGCPSAVPRD